MRVVYVLDRYPALSETFVEAELRELARRGVEVEVVARAGVPAESLRARTRSAPEPAVRYVPRSGRRLIAAALRVLGRHPARAIPALAWAALARRHERGTLRVFAEAAWTAPRVGSPDHLHAHFAHSSATLALLIGRLTGRPFSFTGHAYDLFVASRPPLLRRKIAAARFTVGVSDYSRDWLAGTARAGDRDSVVRVRNGIDLREHAPATGAGDRPRIVTVARLTGKKGVDEAVRACAELRARGVDHDWLVIGDGPLRAELEALAERLGVGDAFTLAGARSNDQVRAALRSAAAFVLPCRVAPDGDRDVAPVAIVEALAAGVPVVTTPVGGIAEIVQDRESALLVAPDDPVALADAVQSVLRDSALRERLRRAGPHVVAAQHDVRKSVAQLTELFAA